MTTEYGWLIENGKKQGEGLAYRFINNDLGGMSDWTEDQNKAIRFARREDAEQFAHHDEDAWRIVHHGWDSLASIAAIEAQVKQAAQPSEQAAFEDWLHRVCPSGDVTDVKRQWEASSDLAEWLESQRTEDVLIDGVAYTVPIEVACELLHLHMALLTKPAQAAQPVYQVREAFVDDPAGTWRDTWEGPFYMVPEADRRIVYTSPPKAAPLTDDQIVSMVEGMLTKTAYNYSVAVQIGIRAARAVEQAHGITPATVEKGGE